MKITGYFLKDTFYIDDNYGKSFLQRVLSKRLPELGPIVFIKMDATLREI